MVLYAINLAGVRACRATDDRRRPPRRPPTYDQATHRENRIRAIYHRLVFLASIPVAFVPATLPRSCGWSSSSIRQTDRHAWGGQRPRLAALGDEGDRAPGPRAADRQAARRLGGRAAVAEARAGAAARHPAPPRSPARAATGTGAAALRCRRPRSRAAPWRRPPASRSCAPRLPPERRSRRPAESGSRSSRRRMSRRSRPAGRRRAARSQVRWRASSAAQPIPPAPARARRRRRSSARSACR